MVREIREKREKFYCCHKIKKRSFNEKEKFNLPTAIKILAHLDKITNLRML